MSHLIKIYAICKFVYFRLRCLKSKCAGPGTQALSLFQKPEDRVIFRINDPTNWR